jgi:hypothetical protein
MRVVLSALTFDPLGVVALDVDPAQVFGDIRRRMNRVATLDGGAVFNDFGYSEADRSIFLSWRVQSAAQEAAVARLVQLYARVRLPLPGACGWRRWSSTARAPPSRACRCWWWKN